MRNFRLIGSLPFAAFSLVSPALATPQTEEYVTAHGKAQSLKNSPVIGGRLGLSVQHNPATINIIQRSLMEQRGYAHAEEAADSAPGVSSGGSPGSPAQFMMRGFSGSQILILRDGIYYGPTTMVNRPLNTFNLESVQVLKGPSSVLYGQGAVGGTVDMRTRDPVFDAPHANALVSYGSFNTWNAGVGGSIPITKTLAIRSDFSRTSSDGYVKGADPHSNDFTTTLLWHPNRSFSARLSVDYLTDQLSTYYGTPLVNLGQTGDAAGGLLHSSTGLGVTKSSLWKYYNVRDPKAGSVNATPTLHLSWTLSPHVTLHNKSYFIYAKRRWNNAEAYSYISQAGSTDAAGNPITQGSIGRDRFYVYQNQHQVGDTIDGQFDFHILGFKNRVVVGGDAYYLRFIRNRGFPDATYADSVSLTSPDGGSTGDFAGEFPYRKSPTTMLDAGIFMEDVLTLRKDLRLVGGFRYDWLSLNRQNFNQNDSFSAASSFKGHYNPSNFRIGPVYDLTDNISLYGVYTTAEDPPGSNLFTANRGQFTRLSTSRQGEIGLKATALGGRATTTLSLFDIRRAHVLVSTGPDTVATAGSQKSRGVEWQGDITFNKHWSLSGNVAYTYSRYGNFQPSATINASGNKVPDVPAVTANLWAVWSRAANLPLDLGAGMRYVSERKGNYANTLSLNDYALVNVFAGWHAYHGVTVYGRIDNLANKHFIQWADTSYPSEVMLGAPRSFSISLQAGF
ncbi:TonB-dependent receptor [Gluconobacter wancherniae]|uniref:TonB-dependent receptor n=2 Tax=Gluconobacter wancherniae TaxID=1307955 RepID=A0A511B5D1_9PROT|nr:TonB-dependent receptor [Gluconobacter wancherniae]MBF0853169.1 TonB-dependent receptor [Gluconobacter wancherniae]GBD56113.1 TonB-dependent receptor [Gluconobacter wancherniae NBRC 103581]GBR63221.1 TonB-dependent outermembrane receptor [Gluconobacter wancherniae NBRC 103581]GEK92987.1 TonB-dependent receptor [Gluconobacter wancherniae NBRC 103581]